jgi:effector-binding domain-containing protein
VGDTSHVDPQVRLVEVPSRPTLVVPASTTWSEFSSVWTGLSEEVWDCLRAAGVTSGCSNLMLYLDDVPNVEVGVLCSEAAPLTGRVQVSSLPAGRVATATHRGSYADLGATHDVIHTLCGAHGHELTRTRWEVYGPHDPDPAQVWVEVSWLLA